MTAATQTLADFLLACIAEDEAKAREIHPDAVRDPWIHPGCAAVHYEQARVLAECEAKRRIVQMHAKPHYCSGPHIDTNGLNDPCATVMALALPYADHPDYDEAWRL